MSHHIFRDFHNDLSFRAAADKLGSCTRNMRGDWSLLFFFADTKKACLASLNNHCVYWDILSLYWHYISTTHTRTYYKILCNRICRHHASGAAKDDVNKTRSGQQEPRPIRWASVQKNAECLTVSQCNTGVQCYLWAVDFRHRSASLP